MVALPAFLVTVFLRGSVHVLARVARRNWFALSILDPWYRGLVFVLVGCTFANRFANIVLGSRRFGNTVFTFVAVDPRGAFCF